MLRALHLKGVKMPFLGAWATLLPGYQRDPPAEPLAAAL
jgi:hypothetical protein